MTIAQKLKRTVRARARKTGESDTAARRQVLSARDRSARGGLPAPPPAQASRTPVQDEVAAARVLAATGLPLEHWFDVLERFDALTHGHTAAARHLREVHGVSSWYSQNVTGIFERARGRRVRNQTCAGDFEVSITKVVPAPLARVAAALESARARRRWLGGAARDLLRALEAGLRAPRCRGVRVSERDVRLRYSADGLTVELRVTPKSAEKCAVAVGVLKLPDAQAVATQRAAWRGALEALKAFVA